MIKPDYVFKANRTGGKTTADRDLISLLDIFVLFVILSKHAKICKIDINTVYVDKHHNNLCKYNVRSVR